LKYYIGLLSGTSVDGIDAALVAIDNGTIQLVNTHDQDFSKTLGKDLQSIIQSQSTNLKQLSETDNLLALEFSQAVNKLIEKSQINRKDIIAIGSHGQTIFHQPDGKYKNTMQIGSAHIIAANTKLKVVSNFRNLDVAYGGQGAPLAPLIHQKLFYQDNKNTAVINLGGIANISFIGVDFPQPIGFDTGPANCLMDQWINKFKQLPFDDNGYWAKKGQLSKELLNNMLSDEYFTKPFPKSTGREYFNLNWIESYIEKTPDFTEINIQTTLTHLTAISVCNAINNMPQSIDSIILMGGGAKNKYLNCLIQDYSTIPTVIADDADWIEAILFAYLAYKRLNNEKIDLSAFTGSTHPILVGDIVEP